ncbi:Alanine--tRNA ligase [Raphanus sativus]|nr:Alanine--tRNA ligase [Raphanus sativus]
MGDTFTELKEHEQKITEIIKEEEASFCKTLAKGIEKFWKAGHAVQGNTLSGEDAFVLWDTFGFPIDLTQLMAKEKEDCWLMLMASTKMVEAKERSRSAQISKLVAPSKGDLHGLCFPGKFSCWRESFYAEQGGQIFDTGLIEGSFGAFNVCNVQIFGGFVLHIGYLSKETGELSVGDKVTCKVDYERRKIIAPNHTCTHMLNFALKFFLKKLRFDFSHGKPVDPEDLRKIESIVNKQIKDELDVFSKESVLSEAKRIKGLRGVFGEVYHVPVRVGSIGRQVEDLLADPENDEWSSLSSEFCGGTHITNTRDAKSFALLTEEGIAKGIRRITAVTTECAFDALNEASSLEKDVEGSSKAEGSALEKILAALKRWADSPTIPAAKRADIKAKIALLQGMSIMVFSTDETTNKEVVCEGVPDRSDKFKQLDVTEWLTTALGPLKGRCGKGKSGLASGQGTDASQVKAALDLAASFASMKLN